MPIYLDNHATTPVDPRVFSVMEPYFCKNFGNASSGSHAFGWQAEKAVEEARQQIANFLGAMPEEIIFTSGATESINLALKGAWQQYGKDSGHIITQATEHKAVLDSCHVIESMGGKCTILPVDDKGHIDLQQLEETITPETIMISIMHANNEIGTIYPIEEIGAIARKHNVLFHVDAAQTVGKEFIDLSKMPIDLLSFSAHKLYGPKGIGALFVRSKNPCVRLKPQMHGGGHESGLRSGTSNVPAIVGFGEAVALLSQDKEEDQVRIRRMRDQLQNSLCEQLEGVTVNGDLSNRLAQNLSVSFDDIDAESLIMAINHELAISTGSACTSGQTTTSHVLKAIGLHGKKIHSTVRFGLGKFTTEEEITKAGEVLVEAVTRLRKLSPLRGVDCRDLT